MKKNIILSLAALVTFSSVYAQTSTSTAPVTGVNATTSTQINLEPGFTPESPFFFLDLFSEKIQELLTFNKEAKALLQTEFAKERVAEIKSMLAEKGDHTQGIKEAKTLLVENVSKAGDILKEEKAAGKDISSLAKVLNDKFDKQDRELSKTFLAAGNSLLNEQKDTLEQKLKEAVKAGDATTTSDIQLQITANQTSVQNIKDTKDDFKKTLGEEKKGIEEEMGLEDQQKDALETKRSNDEDSAKEEEESSSTEGQRENSSLKVEIHSGVQSTDKED